MKSESDRSTRIAQPGIASIEERLHYAQRVLTLIHAAANVHPDVLVNKGDLLEAIGAATADVANTLEPLRQAPGHVANWEADSPRGQ